MIKIFKKTTFLLLLLSTLFCSVFFTSCERKAYLSDFHDMKVAKGATGLYFEFTPDHNMTDVVFTIYVYHQELIDGEYFNKQLCYEIEYPMGDLIKGEDYCIDYDVETETHANMEITDTDFELTNGKVIY